MRLLRVLQNNPAVVLFAVAAGFAAWVAANPPRRPDPAGPAAGPPVAAANPILPGVCTPETLARLRPGMTRVEVERVLGSPQADLVRPFDPVSATYQTAYPALFGTVALPPVTRKALPLPGIPDARVAVEFDATRPGHPLVRVHYPDPLF